MIPLALILALTACNKINNNIHIGKDTSEGYSVIDTTTVQASTLLLDSIKTSGTGTLMVGRLNDANFGVTESSSYLPLGIPSNVPDLKNIKTARFDSVRFKLVYNGSYYGDTTQMAGIEIYQLAEKLKLKENKKFGYPDEQSLINTTSALYNNSSFRYNGTLLGSKTFKPRPKGADSVTIKLPNSLGETLYNLIRANDPVVSTQEKFNDYFKGLVLLAAKGSGNNMLNFKGDRTAIQVYYSDETNNGNRKAKSINFNLGDASLQFNRITGNRSGTVIGNITPNKPIDYTTTGNTCFVQSGTGLVTRVKFPYILDWLNVKVNVIHQARLIIEIPKSPNSAFNPPAALNLLVADRKNKPQGVINNFYAKGDQLAILQKNYDGDIQDNMRYVFNITEFLNTFRKIPNNTELSLLISVPLSQFPNSVERVVLGSPGNSKTKIKLELKYTKYKIPD